MISSKNQTQLIVNILNDLGLLTIKGNSKNNVNNSKNINLASNSVKQEVSNKVANKVNPQGWDFLHEVKESDISSKHKWSKFENTTQSLQNDAALTSKTEDTNSLTARSPRILSSTLTIVKQNQELLKNVKTLSGIRDILLKFDGCALAKTAINTVFGVGIENAELLMVGEAPGAEEDLQGEPFVGRSGKLLTKALESIGIYRKNIFIANSVFWRPPGNRTPTDNEMLICKPFVDAIISVIKPKIVLAVGKVAANTLLEEDIAIGKMRGKWYTKPLGLHNQIVNNVQTRVLYHPAYLLRNPRQKKIFWFDLLEIKNVIEKEQVKIYNDTP